MLPPETARAQPPANALLAALAPEEYERLRPRLELVSLVALQPLSEPSESITHVYFPTTAVVSLIVSLEEQVDVEAALIGREGFVGTPLALGESRSPERAVCQIAGEAERIAAATFVEVLADGGRFPQLLQRYTLSLFHQLARASACNRCHAVEARCARWLLMAQDRVGVDQFPLRQEALARMLGVRRSSISEAASHLQRQGIIQYRRGRLSIHDRRRLEAVSCRCYQSIAAEYARLLG